jgi:hypothetical protein
MKAVSASLAILFFLSGALLSGVARAADVVPPEIMQPGTQPGEAGNLESPDKCDNCHGGYDEARAYSNEPAFGWRGSAMGNAGRDPIFWATLAIAEQDFDGAGDLCIRCHSSGGWFAGRSTPTDGSGLQASDDNGVDCDTCHTATNPDNSEHLGVMNPPFVANDGIEGYYGSGMLSLWGGSAKLGPYADADARHQWMQSQYHRADAENDNLCGTCHDVSNPAVGDLAPGNGTQPGAPDVISSGGNLGGPVDEKAAFNNPPYAYGVVERTFSEWKAGALDSMDVRNFPNLPADLQAESGALNMAYQSALLAGGTYEDGTIRTFSCTSCHMRPDIGEGCNKAGALTRSDLPKHDQSGGNYWMWPLIKYQDQQGTLRLGGGLSALQLAAMDAGQIRAEDQLRLAATLSVSGDTVRITNLTGHKLITGYPEGRRMWLNVKWYDAADNLVGEDGAYGPLGVTFTNPVDGVPFEPQSILDLANTKVYEVHPAITQKWAQTLMAVNPTHYGPIALGYDRLTGAPEGTIADLASGNLGPYAKTFHFVLNNHVAGDNRIPPYGMDSETARVRNALPVPTSQYGGGTASYDGMSGVYTYWDEATLVPPSAEAVRADITLYYQGTSWEYVQFLWKANNGTDPAQGGNAFLGSEGVNMLDAWIHADPAAPMVPPFAMATASWPSCDPTPEFCGDGVDNDCDGLTDCEDVADCGLDPACCTAEPEVCGDGADNDCDGAIDCNDSADCAEDPVCQVDCTVYADKGSCSNDPSCEWQGSPRSGMCVELAACVPTALDEVAACGDGVDNDCDGLTDCADALDCGDDPVCQADCSVYTTRNLCNNQPNCSWDSKNKVCLTR